MASYVGYSAPSSHSILKRERIKWAFHVDDFRSGRVCDNPVDPRMALEQLLDATNPDRVPLMNRDRSVRRYALGREVDDAIHVLSKGSRYRLRIADITPNEPVGSVT